jgi:hypothetical protein
MNSARSLVRSQGKIVFIFLAVTLVLGGCGGGSVSSPAPAPVTPTPSISVTVAPVTASVQVGQQMSFTATVANDSSNKGVTWALAGTGCTAMACGTLSAASSASGVAITYTAPASVPNPASVTLTATSVTDGTKTSATSITITAAPPAIAVTLSQTTVGLMIGGTASFTATVTNDAATKGVTWSLSGAGCSGATCGTLSATSTASGAAVTYSAPSTLPSPATVALTATSITDGTKSATATITLTAAPSPIAVSLSQTAATVPVNGTTSFIATVANDTSNRGVNWTLSGAGCSGAACGTLSSSSSASGVGVTYTAPSSVPSPATVTLTATSVADSTKTAAATITITAGPAIVVSVSPMTASIATGGATSSFTATVQNDSQNKGVTWTLSGADCSGATCGTVSPTSSASGVAVTYTSPGTASGTTVTLTATSVAASAVSAASTITLTPLLPKLINLGLGQGPELVVDTNGNIDLAWTNAGVVFARSTDSGNTLTTKQISNGGSLFGMAVDASARINLLTFFNSAFTLDASSDGTNFVGSDVSSLILSHSAPELLASPSGSVVLPQITISTGIFLGLVSQNRVVTVSEDFDVDFDLVAASGPQGQIYLAWQKQSNSVAQCAIVFSASLDGGLTFSRPLNISNNPAECAELPQFYIDAAGGVNLAWTTIAGFQDNNGPLVNPNELYFARSTDQGQTWSTPTPLVGINQYTGSGDDASGVGDPQIAEESSGAIDVVFDATTTTDTIALFARSTDGGKTFGTPLTLATGGANTPNTVIDSCGGINVVYAGATDIFFTRSTDGGATFTPPTNLSNASKSEFNALIAAGGKNVYVVWEDLTNIYFQAVKVCP